MASKIEKLQHKAEVARLKAEIETAKVAVAEAHTAMIKAISDPDLSFTSAHNAYGDAVLELIGLRNHLAALTAPAKEA
jgi:hypothetical protein